MSCGAFAECLDPAIYTSLTRPGIKGWGVLLMVGKSLLANGWASHWLAMQCKLLAKILYFGLRNTVLFQMIRVRYQVNVVRYMCSNRLGASEIRVRR